MTFQKDPSGGSEDDGSSLSVKTELGQGHHKGVTKIPQTGIHEVSYIHVVVRGRGRAMGSRENSSAKEAGFMLVTRDEWVKIKKKKEARG